MPVPVLKERWRHLLSTALSGRSAGTGQPLQLLDDVMPVAMLFGDDLDETAFLRGEHRWSVGFAVSAVAAQRTVVTLEAPAGELSYVVVEGMQVSNDTASTSWGLDYLTWVGIGSTQAPQELDQRHQPGNLTMPAPGVRFSAIAAATAFGGALGQWYTTPGSIIEARIGAVLVPNGTRLILTQNAVNQAGFGRVWGRTIPVDSPDEFR